MRIPTDSASPANKVIYQRSGYFGRCIFDSRGKLNLFNWLAQTLFQEV